MCRAALVALPLVVWLGACEGGGSSSGAPPEADAGLDAGGGGGGDAAVESGGSDASDSGTTDAGACPTYGEEDKICLDVSDCAMVARGCYCGQQPVLGVKKAVVARAAACETKAQDECALGCANFPGKVAEDGQSDQDGGTIDVICTVHQCKTVVR